MRAACLGVLVVVLSYACAPARTADYAVGADLSFLKQAEDRGAVFKDEGEARPALRIVRWLIRPVRGELSVERGESGPTAPEKLVVECLC
jgi:hypothetical protein